MNFRKLLGGKLALLFFESCFGYLLLHYLSCKIVHFRRHGVHFRADKGAGFVHKVNSLIGEETVGNITVGQNRRRNESGVLNLYSVKNFVTLF